MTLPSWRIIGAVTGSTANTPYWVKKPRAFSGWAFTGFDRGGALRTSRATWMPMGDEPDLPARFTPNRMVRLKVTRCRNSAWRRSPHMCIQRATSLPSIPPLMPSTTQTVIDCDLLAFGGEGNEDEAEMFVSVMDAPDMPGMGTRAIVFSILPREANRYRIGRDLPVDALVSHATRDSHRAGGFDTGANGRFCRVDSRQSVP